MRKWPPHFLLHAIEAKAAYSRGHRDKIANERDLRRIVNHYHRAEDPHLTELLRDHGGLDPAMSALQAQQFFIQRRPNWLYAALPFAVFCKQMPQTNEWFVEHFGYSIVDLLRVHFATWAVLHDNQFVAVRRSSYDDIRSRFSPEMPSDRLDRILADSSYQQANLGAEFLQRRESLNEKRLHWRGRSCFEDRPLIQFGDEFICPSFGALVGNAERSILRKTKSAPAFSDEVGPAFEGYLKGAIADVFDEFFRPDEVSKGKFKACDFAIPVNDCLVLIECKAAGEDATLGWYLPSAIERSNAMKKVRTSLPQFAGTLENLEAIGVKSDFGFCLAITVLMGEINFPNSQWRHDRYTSDAVKTQLPDNLIFLVLSAQSFVQLLSLCKSEPSLIAKLIRDWSESNYHLTGDLDRHLVAIARDQNRSFSRLPHIDANTDAFLRSVHPRVQRAAGQQPISE